MGDIENRIAVLTVGAASIRRYDVPAEQFDRHARGAMSRAIAEHIVNDRFATMVERPAPDGMPGDTEIIMTVGLISTEAAASMETRIAERQEEVAAEVVSEARRLIRGWGSDFGWQSVGKDDACRFISEALRNVLGRRALSPHGEGE